MSMLDENFTIVSAVAFVVLQAEAPSPTHIAINPYPKIFQSAVFMRRFSLSVIQRPEPSAVSEVPLMG